MGESIPETHAHQVRFDSCVSLFHVDDAGCAAGEAHPLEVCVRVVCCGESGTSLAARVPLLCTALSDIPTQHSTIKLLETWCRACRIHHCQHCYLVCIYGEAIQMARTDRRTTIHVVKEVSTKLISVLYL